MCNDFQGYDYEKHHLEAIGDTIIQWVGIFITRVFLPQSRSIDLLIIELHHGFQICLNSGEFCLVYVTLDISFHSHLPVSTRFENIRFHHFICYYCYAWLACEPCKWLIHVRITLVTGCFAKQMHSLWKEWRLRYPMVKPWELFLSLRLSSEVL